MLDSLRRSWTTEHRRCQEDLSAFLDGQLTPRDRARVQTHLRECADCRADLDALRHTVSLLRAVPVLKPPRSFVLPAPEVKRQRQARRQRLAYVYLQAATAVATVLLVLVVSGDAFLRYAPAQPGARLSEARPPATAVELESAPVAGDSALPEPAPQTMQVPPAPTPAPTEQPLAAGALPAPEQSPEALALEVGTETADAGPATGTEMAKAQAEETAAVKAKPSQTFVLAAPPPVPPTPEEESTAREAVQTADPTTTPLPSPSNTPVPPTETPMPRPTDTPVPPTATPMPSPTNTPVPPMAEPSPTSPVAPPVPAAELAPPGPAPGLWARSEGLRPILRRVEAVLALAVAMLFAATLWLRRRQRLV